MSTAVAATLRGKVGTVFWGEASGGRIFWKQRFPSGLRLRFCITLRSYLGGVSFYYDVPSDACNGFPWPFCTEGRTSLQKKVHVKQGKFAATWLLERSNPFLAVAATVLKQQRQRWQRWQWPGQWQQLHFVPLVTGRRRKSGAISSESDSGAACKDLAGGRLRAPHHLVNYVERLMVSLFDIYVLTDRHV